MRNINSISSAIGGIDDAVKIDPNALEEQKKVQEIKNAQLKEAHDAIAAAKEKAFATLGVKTDEERFAEAQKKREETLAAIMKHFN